MKKYIITFISLIVIVILVDIFLYTNNNEYKRKQDELNNAIGSNVFEVISLNRALDYLESKDGIIYFTKNDDLEYTENLNTLSFSLNIDKIFYVTIKDEDYESLSEHLENNLDEKINTPILVTVNDGVLLSVLTLSDYSGYELDKKIIKSLSSFQNTNYDNMK